MLQSVVEQRMSLAAYGSDYSIPALTATQLDMANKVINVLSPVEEITKGISKDTTCILMIIPSVRGLRKTLEQSLDDRGICTMKFEILESLHRRFSEIKETDFLVISTMLDPQFKDKFFSSKRFHENAKVLLQKLYEGENEPKEPVAKRVVTEEGVTKSKLWCCLTEILSESNEITDVMTGSEVEQYLLEPLTDLKVGAPYKWWKLNNGCYSILSKLARKYLSALPTSVPSECLFSGAGETYNDRSCLKPEFVEDLLLVKYNFPSVGDSYQCLL